jgi:hypothetical protein
VKEKSLFRVDDDLREGGDVNLSQIEFKMFSLFTKFITYSEKPHHVKKSLAKSSSLILIIY